MLIFIKEIAMQIFIWVLQLCDGVMELFMTFTGVSRVEADGETGTMLNIVFSSSTISSIFWAIVVLAVGLAAIFTIIAIIRNMIRNDKRVSEIVGRFFIAVLGTMAVLLVVIICMMIVDELVVLLADIFQINSSTKLSSLIFDACVGKWNKVDGYTYSIADFDVSTVKVSDILGGYNSWLGVWPKSWKGDGMIAADDFYYLPALISSISGCVFLFIAVIQLGRRVYELVFCYFCMPAALSALPLDDGVRLKNWTQAFTARLVLVFGCIISVNVFAIVEPLLITMEIPGLGGIGNCVFMCINVVAGAMMIPMGSRLFERIFISREEAFFDGRHGFMMGFRWVTRQAGKGARYAEREVKKGAGYVSTSVKNVGGGQSGAYKETDGGLGSAGAEGGLFSEFDGGASDGGKGETNGG